MKKLLILPFFIAAFTSMILKSDVLGIGEKAPLPENKMQDVMGKAVSFNDVKKEKGLLVVFSCNTCPWVIKNQGVALEAYKYALSKNIGVIVLNSNEAERGSADSKEAMLQYANDQKYEWPYVMDENSSMANAFGAKVTPECYLFDSELKLVYHGAITDNPKTPSESTRDHLKLAVDELVSGKMVSMTTSKAMGCQIKRKS